MQRKHSIIAASIGLAFAGFAGQSAALTLADGAPEVEVYLSGATAQDAGLGSAIAKACDVAAGVSTLDRFTIASPTHFAYYCSIGGKRTAIYKESVSGSGNGVTPLGAPGSTLSFMSIANTGGCGTATAVASITVGTGIPGYRTRTCTSAALDATPRRPIAGMSDVEPSFFGSAPGIISESRNLLTFGIAITENLYRVLQAAQGKDSSTTTAWAGNVSSITGIATIPVRDNEDNMPTLSMAQISGLLSGNVGWDSLRKADGTALALPTDPTFYLARRGNTSGTQKTWEVLALGGSSGKCNAQAPAMPSSGNNNLAICTTPGGTTVFEGGSSGNVRSCMSAHNTNGRWAMGLLSTESKYSDQTGNGFRFVKIDGASPSLVNSFQGKYKGWVEQSLNRAHDFAAGPWNTDQRNTVDAVFANLGDGSVLQAINGTFSQVWGAGTLMQTFFAAGPAPYDPLTTITQALVQQSPIAPVSKTLDPLLGPDNCNVPFGFGPTSAQF